MQHDYLFLIGLPAGTGLTLTVASSTGERRKATNIAQDPCIAVGTKGRDALRAFSDFSARPGIMCEQLIPSQVWSPPSSLARSAPQVPLRRNRHADGLHAQHGRLADLAPAVGRKSVAHGEPAWNRPRRPRGHQGHSTQHRQLTSSPQYRPTSLWPDRAQAWRMHFKERCKRRRYATGRLADVLCESPDPSPATYDRLRDPASRLATERS